MYVLKNELECRKFTGIDVGIRAAVLMWNAENLGAPECTVVVEVAPELELGEAAVLGTVVSSGSTVLGKLDDTIFSNL